MKTLALLINYHGMSCELPILLESSPQSQRDKLQDEYDKLKTSAVTHDCPFNVLLGILGRRFYHNVDPKLEKLFAQIASGINPLEGKIISEELCLHIRETCKIGQEKWDHLRQLLEPAVILSSRYKLQNYAIEKHPPLEFFLDGIWCPLNYVIPSTIKDLLECQEDYDPSIDNPDSLELNALAVLLYDGSGSHAQVQGKDIDINTRNIILSK